MGKWTGTIIGGGIGWALLGPLGAIFGARIRLAVFNVSADYSIGAGISIR